MTTRELARFLMLFVLLTPAVLGQVRWAQAAPVTATVASEIKSGSTTREEVAKVARFLLTTAILD